MTDTPVSHIEPRPDELQALRCQLDNLQRRQHDFVTMVGHELRVPLTSLKGILSMMASGMVGPVPEKARHMLDVALESTDRMARLVSDLLDVQRLESGRLTIVKTPVAVRDLLETASEVLRPLAQSAEVTLQAIAIDQQVMADPDRMVQTLTNLLSNAVKFSPAGGIVLVRAQVVDGDVLFSVEDRGRGLPSDKLETIFEPFVQVLASDSREKGGTGLGLAISRGMVEQHGGRIWAESRPGGGSAFRFTIPLADAPTTSG